MTYIAEFKNHEIEDLQAAQDALKSEGGEVLLKMMNEGMNLFMNKVLNTEDGADRNRGRCDVYSAFLRLPGSIAQEINERQKES